MDQTSYEYIDLFSGCGGLALGMENAGWKALFAIEKNEDAFDTLQCNLLNRKKHFIWPDWMPQTALDINVVIAAYEKKLVQLKGKISLVAGGPPCQGFSCAGRRNENDARNSLVDSYLRFIDLIEPESVLFENVKGFTQAFKANDKNTNGKKYSDYIDNELRKRGYAVAYRMIDFSKYGVPQRRTRFILFASKKFNPEELFEIFESNSKFFLKDKKLRKKVSLSCAISDLEFTNGAVPCPDSKGFLSGRYGKAKSNYQRYCRVSEKKGDVPNSHRFANHRPDTLKRFTELHQLNLKNKNLSHVFKDSYNVKKNCFTILDAYAPAPTLTSNPDDHLHYAESRTLTVREYARIQSFPDWYIFKGKYTTGGIARKTDVPRYTQIGNAIPPLIAEQIGISLIMLMDQYSKRAY